MLQKCIAKNNWRIEDFDDLPNNTRILFCDHYCLCTTIRSLQGIGNTRYRMKNQINQDFIDELNTFYCWITEIYEVIEETPLSNVYRNIELPANCSEVIFNSTSTQPDQHFIIHDSQLVQ